MGEEDLRRRVEHLRADERARRLFEQAPYRAVVEDMTELVVRWRPDGTRVFVNDAYCRLFETPREELIGTSFWPLITEEDRARVRERIARLSPENPVSTGRHRAERPSGELVWMEWTDRALFDEDWTLVELQSVGRDITDRVHTQEELRRVERADAVSKASSAIAHDLSSVFQVLSSHLEWVGAVSMANSLPILRAAVKRGKELLTQLKELRYGRVLQPMPVDLSRRVEGSLGLLREVAGYSVRIVARLSAEPCGVLGDPTQIDQVLFNLVRNAAEAATGTGTIVLTTESLPRDRLDLAHRWPGEPPAECSVLRVTDESGGIPESILGHIFETQVTTKEAGHGMGLAIVKTIVDAHGASIAVSTSASGTVFEVAFPAVRLSASPAPP